MVSEGALADCDAAFGLHVWPQLPAGTIATRPGPLMAGVLSFEATVRCAWCSMICHFNVPQCAIHPAAGIV